MKRTHFLLLALSVLFAGNALAKSPINKTTFSGLAIKGYDPVAYFTQKKPVKGEKAFRYSWNDATWRFASAANLAAFKAAPEKYAPQYGGYCAWAVAQGDTANIDPTQWTVHDGKLYLNYNADIQKKWTADKAGFIQKANANWPAVLK